MEGLCSRLINFALAEAIGSQDVRTDDKSLIRFDFLEPTYLLAVGIVLLGAVVSVGGDLGLRAPLIVIGIVWGLHLSVGLAALRLSVIGLSRWWATAGWSDPPLLASAGLLTSLVLAPFSFAIDQVLTALGVVTDDAPLSTLGQWPIGIFEEWTRVVGPALLVALLLGLPAWWSRRNAPSIPVPTAEPAAPVVEPETPATVGSCLQRLPPALGTDLIAVRSELQYVRIYTTRGDALVLGALKDIAEQREADGQLVHRSWWVSNRHVRTLRRRGTRYMLTMTNGLEIPVSRRRQPTLISQFGSSATLN
ncbi:MAG: LytTR family transcriptional regulator [Gammaproteobacteria bacterium]|nr:LytTR family transcriptional regulator [Gammaproteobacteria bacterium]